MRIYTTKEHKMLLKTNPSAAKYRKYIVEYTGLDISKPSEGFEYYYTNSRKAHDNIRVLFTHSFPDRKIRNIYFL